MNRRQRLHKKYHRFGGKPHVIIRRGVEALAAFAIDSYWGYRLRVMLRTQVSPLMRDHLNERGSEMKLFQARVNPAAGSYFVIRSAR